MKNIFLFLFLAPTYSFAQNILFQAPQVSAEKYQSYLKSHPTLISYVDFVQISLQKNVQQEDRLFTLGDVFQNNVTLAIETLKNIQAEGALTITGLRYLRDITDKALALKSSPNEKQELLYMYCKSVALLNEGPTLHNCPAEMTSLERITKRYPQVEKIFIESILHSNSQTVALAPKTAYQWTLVSNTHQPIRFLGTFEQLLNQHFILVPFIEGTCEAFAFNETSLEITPRSLLYFSDQCAIRGYKDPEQKSWFAENKKGLIYGASALLVGGILYGMKDKKLVINTSSFK